MKVDHDEFWDGDDRSCDYFTERGEWIVTRNFDEVEAAAKDLHAARAIASKKGVSMGKLAEMIRLSIQGQAAEHHKMLSDEGYSTVDQRGLIQTDYDQIIWQGICDVADKLNEEP